MKKIITMLFSTALFTSAFAQTNHHDADDRNKNVNDTWNSNTNHRGYDKDHDRDDRTGVYDKRNNGNTYQNYPNNNGYQNNNYSAQREMQMQRISQQYDYRIQQISSDWSMNRRQKQRAIAQLQAEKAQALNSMYSQYNNRNVNNDRDNDRDRNNSYNRSNGNNGYYRK